LCVFVVCDIIYGIINSKGFSMQSYQDLVHEVMEIVEDEIGVVDPDGTVLACSDSGKVGSNLPDTILKEILKNADKTVTVGGITFCKVYSGRKIIVLTYIYSVSETAEKLLNLFSISVLNYYQFCLSRLDRSSFFRSIIMENLSEHEIINRARELRIPVEMRRIVFHISVPGADDSACLSVLKNMFPDRSNSSVFIVNSSNYILVHSLKSTSKHRHVTDIAYMIKDNVSSELMADTRVAIGTESVSLTDLKKSYQNAVMADITGRIFEGKEKIADYNKLGIGRLIYKLPEESCRIFLEEVFPGETYKTFDEEMFKTIEGLFECNFNISKTAEMLFVHRNSVIYRIQKIQKITGLDVRNFNDAVIFKIAMLVSKYLSYIDKQKKVD
jgi:carbohydrate diacid regulator